MNESMADESKAAREWLDETARRARGAGRRFRSSGTRNESSLPGVSYFRNMFDVLNDHYQCPCEENEFWVPSMDAMTWTPPELPGELEMASRSHP